MSKLLFFSFTLFLVGGLFFACKKKLLCEDCDNIQPVAKAGNNFFIVLPNDSATLDGSASYDPDGRISTYNWSHVSGPASFTIITPQSAITKIKRLVLGVYKFELRITDNKGTVDRDTVTITVDNCGSSNHPPVANAGTDLVITLPNNTANLNGGQSIDPDNNIIGYEWSKISGPVSFNIANPFSSQTQVTSLSEGDYQLELKVTDAGGLVSKDTIGIRVLPAVATSIIIIDDLVWNNLCYQPDIPGACWINGDSPSYGFTIKDTANTLPDFATTILGVWVRMDTSNVWEQVPYNCWQFPSPYPQSNFTYCITPNSLSVWSWFLSMEDLAGRRADFKIAF